MANYWAKMTSILAGIAVKLARSLVHIQQVTCATVRYQLPMLSVSEINTLPNAQLLNQLNMSMLQLHVYVIQRDYIHDVHMHGFM